ncbi:hypothetical protein KM803_04990 [Clostridium tyrobutyricum]|jgi:hypothetical protein|uniref:hypothetical protein n=1 Tax=Clostridium tyrobutyricum TaxID=1519 RepID=UPI001C393FE6|nr:hypothetical protein [Clostridium tyrobutyricum]MBV4430691.1 hypothetical protein [Clostridium tyrobutyricum]
MDLTQNIISKDIILIKMDTKKIPFKKETDKVSFKSIAKYSIKNNKDGQVIILLKINSGFVPEIFLNVKFEFIANIKFESPVKDSDIQENIEDILYPLGSRISYLISVITREMDGDNLIVPPSIDEYMCLKEDETDLEQK